MNFGTLYRSVFAILRVEGTQGNVAGTGFVINSNPIRILTCHHVVSEATPNNDGNVKYYITKRTDNDNDFDLRQVQISYLRAVKIASAPQFDLAILEIDPNENLVVSELLAVTQTPALELSFVKEDRILGGDVEWLSTASSGDMTLTPRFFKGNLITKYVINQPYAYLSAPGVQTQQIIDGANILEIDKLFIPGCSGSPILNVDNKVIGFVHGFKSWPIPTNTEVAHPFELTENNASRLVDLKYKIPLMASISLGIDIRTIETYLRDNNFIDN